MKTNQEILFIDEQLNTEQGTFRSPAFITYRAFSRTDKQLSEYQEKDLLNKMTLVERKLIQQ